MQCCQIDSFLEHLILFVLNFVIAVYVKQTAAENILNSVSTKIVKMQ